MKNLILILCICWQGNTAQAQPAQPKPDALEQKIAPLQTEQEKQATQIELLEKKIDLAKESSENRLNAIQLGIEKQLFYLDPLILTGVGISAIGGLIYLYFFFVPKRVREETTKKIALLTDSDRSTVLEIIATHEISQKMKQSAKITVLCADDAQKANAQTLLKEVLRFKNITFDAAADFDLMIFYDPKGDESKWDNFKIKLNENLASPHFLYFGKPKQNFNGIHENLNYANSKFTLEGQIIKTLQFHPRFKNA